MFAVNEATADAIRRAWHERGEPSAVAELRRHFAGDANARSCVRAIVGWASRPAAGRTGAS